MSIAPAQLDWKLLEGRDRTRLCSSLGHLGLTHRHVLKCLPTHALFSKKLLLLGLLRGHICTTETCPWLRLIDWSSSEHLPYNQLDALFFKCSHRGHWAPESHVMFGTEEDILSNVHAEEGKKADLQREAGK